MNTQRFQLALNVQDIDEAVAYYSKLFDAKVNKRKPGYANFAIDNPPLKLVLLEDKNATERLNHAGVESFSQENVDAAIERFGKEGIQAGDVEDGKTCCFAKQNKIWSEDPQGLKWEWYKVLEDAEHFGEHSPVFTAGQSCCNG